MRAGSDASLAGFLLIVVAARKLFQRERVTRFVAFGPRATWWWPVCPGGHTHSDLLGNLIRRFLEHPLQGIFFPSKLRLHFP